MNPYLVAILAVLLARFALDLAGDMLNLRHLSPGLPAEFVGHYDAAKYRTSQEYLREKTRFGVTTDVVSTVVLIAVILSGAFQVLDKAVRAFGFGPVLTGVIFLGVVVLAARVLDLPFSIHRTFVIEAKYGFNKTTPGTFVMDLVKELALTAVIGGLLLAVVLWFFEKAGERAWLICWAAVTVFQVVMIFLAPVVIMPLFNKFTPLPDGELKGAIEKLAREQDFAMRGIYTMDASKRSAKTNAFFTGFGRSRRIVLFDTLIEKHTVPEVVAILAHEIGHYKRHHVPWAIARSVAFTGLTLFLFSLMAGNARLQAALQIREVSIHAGLLVFGFLYTPISMGIGLMENVLSRKHEYQADRFAVEASRDPEAMISGLKKLTVDNLSNLTPHPFKVFMDYSHPPVLARIEAIRELAKEPAPAGAGEGKSQ